MKVMLIVCDDAELSATIKDEQAFWDECRAWGTEMTTRGIRIYGNILELPEKARTVRVRNGKPVLSDGPFAETKEVIGGFDILECASMDEALEVAARHPVARYGAIEVRPLGRE
jgi:hypothetical protein